MDLIEYHVPKLTRAEIRAVPASMNDRPIESAEQASLIYGALMSGDLDVNSLTFAVPAPATRAAVALPAPEGTT